MNQRDENEALLKIGVTLAICQEIGFEPAPSSRLPALLRNIKPSGSTAMRDAVLESALLLIKLGDVMQKIMSQNIWNIVNIVLTDGDDTSSKAPLGDTCQALKTIGQHIPINTLKTYFIGVGLETNSKAAIEIASMVKSEGKNAQYLSVDAANIEEVFEKIKISLGVVQRTQAVAARGENGNFMAVRQQQQAFLLAEKQMFIVLFTLDMSGSMSGGRWTKVCSSVDRFVRMLGPEDLICGIAFNENVYIITKPIDQGRNYRPAPAPAIQHYNNNATIQNVIHNNVRCDGCHQNPIRGKRYKCRVCPDFDYCEACYKSLAKQHNHSFMLFRYENSNPEVVRREEICLGGCSCNIF